MNGRLKFLVNRLSERLWLKPLIMSLLSVGAAFAAGVTDLMGLGTVVPDMPAESVEALLNVMATSMLVIATFAVASMVSAYASASSTATPRAFALVVADDVSQNALSVFIGAFIFSIVALSFLKYGYYATAGRFSLFVLTLAVFAMVVLTFVRWVDRIARLGRMTNSIDKVEQATEGALKARRRAPTLGCRPPGDRPEHAQAVYGPSIGYIRRVEVADLQAYAEDEQLRIEVASLPGVFVAPGCVLAWVWAEEPERTNVDLERVGVAFRIGDNRTYDEDPRFGLVVLSEIASRALSTGVNDPGTAIEVVHTLVKLLTTWSEPVDEDELATVKHDRVMVPEVDPGGMFEDAFRSIARDGAGTIEVVVHLLRALESLARSADEEISEQACEHARMVLARAEQNLDFPADVQTAREAAAFARQD